MGMMTNARQIMMDTLYNLLSGLGTSKDKTTGATYVLNTWDDASLEAAYRGDWLTRKIIDIPAEDATREWRAWQAEDDQIEELEELEARHNILYKVQRAMILGRLYGGAGLVLGVKNAGGGDTELDLERVKKDSLQFVHVVSRRDLNAGPMVTDLMSPWFGRPEYYERQVANSMPIRIHPSRVIPFIGKPCPDGNSSPANLGWGDPIMQSVDDAIKQAGIVQGSIATLVQESKVDIIRMPELSANLSSEEYANRLTARFSYANSIKSITNALLLDKEEEWERINVNFAGLPEVAKIFLQVASGAADIPATRLLGQAPIGMNSTGESDIRNYYDRLRSDQVSTLSPALTPLDEILIRSSFGSRDPAIHYIWNPLWQMSPVEKADLAHKKATTFVLDLNSGLFAPEVLRKMRQNQLIEDGTYPGLENAVEEEEGDVIPMVEAEELAIEGQRKALLEPPGGLKKKPFGRDTFDDAFDPNQPRDPDGKWTSTMGEVAERHGFKPVEMAAGMGHRIYRHSETGERLHFYPQHEENKNVWAHFTREGVQTANYVGTPEAVGEFLRNPKRRNKSMDAGFDPNQARNEEGEWSETGAAYGEGFKKIGGAKGSNQGGIYQAPDGSKHYVKFYKEPDQGRAEVLAAKLYERMGIPTVQPRIGNVDGKEAVIAPWNANLENIPPKELENLKSQKNIEQLARMEAAAKLTKNWDIVGLVHDNIVRDKVTGDLVSVDQGGSFNYRAQGGPKDYGTDPADADFTKSNNAATRVFKQVDDATRTAAVNAATNVATGDLFASSGMKNTDKLYKSYQVRAQRLRRWRKLDSSGFDPNQPRDPDGKWTETGSSGETGFVKEPMWSKSGGGMGGKKIEQINLEKFTTEGKKLNTLQAQELKLRKMLAVENDPAKQALIKKHIVATLKAQHKQNFDAGKFATAAKLEYKLSKFGEGTMLAKAQQIPGINDPATPEDPMSEKALLSKLTPETQKQVSEAIAKEAAKAGKYQPGEEAAVIAALEGVTGDKTSAKAYTERAKTLLGKNNLNLPLKEAALINAYTGSVYGTINKALRAGVMTEPQWGGIKSLNDALDKMPVYNGTVHRKANLPADVRALYKPGMVIEERGFTSTSKSQGTWHGATRYSIASKSGRNVQPLSNHQHEKEVLFKSGTRFRIKSVVVNAKTTDIDMEEV